MVKSPSTKSTLALTLLSLMIVGCGGRSSPKSTPTLPIVDPTQTKKEQKETLTQRISSLHLQPIDLNHLERQLGQALYLQEFIRDVNVLDPSDTQLLERRIQDLQDRIRVRDAAELSTREALTAQNQTLLRDADAARRAQEASLEQIVQIRAETQAAIRAAHDAAALEHAQLERDHEAHLQRVRDEAEVLHVRIREDAAQVIRRTQELAEARTRQVQDQADAALDEARQAIITNHDDRIRLHAQLEEEVGARRRAELLAARLSEEKLDASKKIAKSRWKHLAQGVKLRTQRQENIRLRFLQVTSSKESAQELSRVFSALQSAQEQLRHSNAFHETRAQELARLEQTERELRSRISSLGEASTASEAAHVHQLAELQAQIAQITHQKDGLSKGLRGSEEQLRAHEAQIQDLNHIHDRLREENTEFRVREERANLEVSRLKAELESTTSRTESETAVLLQHLRDAERQALAARTALQEHEAVHLSDLAEFHRKAQATEQALKRDQEALRLRTASLEDELGAATKRADLAQAHILENERHLRELNRRIDEVTRAQESERASSLEKDTTIRDLESQRAQLLATNQRLAEQERETQFRIATIIRAKEASDQVAAAAESARDASERENVALAEEFARRLQTVVASQRQTAEERDEHLSTAEVLRGQIQSQTVALEHLTKAKTGLQAELDSLRSSGRSEDQEKIARLESTLSRAALAIDVLQAEIESAHQENARLLAQAEELANRLRTEGELFERQREDFHRLMAELVHDNRALQERLERAASTHASHSESAAAGSSSLFSTTHPASPPSTGVRGGAAGGGSREDISTHTYLQTLRKIQGELAVAILQFTSTGFGTAVKDKDRLAEQIHSVYAEMKLGTHEELNIAKVLRELDTRTDKKEQRLSTAQKFEHSSQMTQKFEHLSRMTQTVQQGNVELAEWTALRLLFLARTQLDEAEETFEHQISEETSRGYGAEILTGWYSWEIEQHREHAMKTAYLRRYAARDPEYFRAHGVSPLMKHWENEETRRLKIGRSPLKPKGTGVIQFDH